jgi:hypothetical protein
MHSVVIVKRGSIGHIPGQFFCVKFKHVTRVACNMGMYITLRPMHTYNMGCAPHDDASAFLVVLVDSQRQNVIWRLDVCTISCCWTVPVQAASGLIRCKCTRELQGRVAVLGQGSCTALGLIVTFCAAFSVHAALRPPFKLKGRKKAGNRARTRYIANGLQSSCKVGNTKARDLHEGHGNLLCCLLSACSSNGENKSKAQKARLALKVGNKRQGMPSREEPKGIGSHSASCQSQTPLAARGSPIQSGVEHDVLSVKRTG